MFKRRYQRLIGIITSTVILFAVLAPSISHALPAKNRTQALWQDVCSVKGSKLIVASFSIKDSSQQPQKNNTGMHLEHCPYCFTHISSAELATNSHFFSFLALSSTPILIEHYPAHAIAQHYYISPPSQAPPSST